MTILYTKSKVEILDQIMNSLEKNAGITATSPGSIARAFAEAISDQIGDLYTMLRYNIDQTMISTASGRNLDLIGELYSVPRKLISEEIAGDRNIANIVFSISKPYSKDILIPKDTLVFNNINSSSTIQFKYKLVGDVTIPTSSTRVYGQVVAAFSDATYTASIGSLSKHNFISPPGVIVSVTNVKEVVSQINYESDDAYRRRIIRSVKVNTNGTAESLRLSALSVRGVKDVRIREGSFGMGSCDIIVVPESGSFPNGLEREISQSIQSIRPVGIRMTVRVAQRIPVSISANVLLTSGTENAATGIANQAAYFAKKYLNSFTIGDVLDITLLKNSIMSASDLISEVIINSISVNGTEVPKENFQLPSERSYMVAGLVELYPAIIGYS